LAADEGKACQVQETSKKKDQISVSAYAVWHLWEERNRGIVDGSADFVGDSGGSSNL
jgi:hypothetical protein